MKMLPANRDRNPPFAISAGITVIGGVAILGFLIYSFRKPRVERIEVPGQTVVVERPVEKPAEKVVERIVEKPVPYVVEAPRKAVIESRGVFDGGWQLVGKTLPVFVLHQSGDVVSGHITTPDLSGTYPFTGGKVKGLVLEFTAATATQRVHYRFTLQSDGTAVLEVWYTAEDLMQMVNIARRTVRDRNQAYLLERAFIKEFRRVGQPLKVGTFRRLPNGY